MLQGKGTIVVSFGYKINYMSYFHSNTKQGKTLQRNFFMVPPASARVKISTQMSSNTRSQKEVMIRRSAAVPSGSCKPKNVVLDIYSDGTWIQLYVGSRRWLYDLFTIISYKLLRLSLRGHHKKLLTTFCGGRGVTDVNTSQKRS